MASNDDMFGIKIKISWTPQDLTKQIQDIQKYITANHKLNINLNLNENTLKGLERLSQLSKSAAKELNAIKAPMFNLDNPNQEAQKYIGTINNLVSTFQKFKGQTSVVYDEFGKVSLKVDTASGAIKRYTLQWDELTQRLSRTNMKNSDNSNVNIERELQLRQRLNAQIQSNADSLEHYLRIQQMNLNSSMSRFETQRTGLYNVDELNNLRTRLNQLTPTTENLRRNVGLLRAEFNSLNTTAIANGINTVNRNAMSLGESLKLVAFKMLTWLGMGNLIFGTISQIKSAVVFIKDLDSAMINLKKVTNETDMAYKEFENDSSNLGKSLARTTIEVIKATTNFAKMGYTLREAKELAKEALIMQNVGDIENVDKATQYLISTLKGFDLQVSESSKVIDIMNEVSNKHSISVDGLGSAYERSSAVMAQAGNTIEETTALLTAANAVVQNPEKVGNGFKTLALRLRGVDEESKDVFPKLEADLSAVGVQIRNVDGGFRSTYNILKDFSKVYMGMDDMSRSKLLEDMGGKYQANVLAATLQNFSEAEKTMGDALTSVGSSAKENEVYLTSVEAKVKQFRVSLEELYKLFFSSDLLKGGIGVLSGLVSLLNGVSSVFGGIPALAGASTTAVLVFSSALRTSIYETIRLKVEQYGLLRSIPVLWSTATGGVRGFSGALAFLRTGLTSTRISVIALQTTMTLGLSLAITGVITLVQKLVEHLGKSKESMEEQSQAFKDILDNLSNMSSDYSKAKELIDVYNKLSGVTNKTVDEKQKLIDVQQQLAQLFPSLVTGYDLEGQAILDVSSKHSNLLDKKKEEIDLETKRLSSQFYQNQSTWIQAMVVSQTELNNLKKEQNDIQDNIDNVKTNTGMSEDVKESYLVGWYEKFDAVSEKISTTQGKLNEIKSTYDQGLTSTVKYELESLKLSNDVINNFSDNYLSLVGTLKNSGKDPSVALRGIFESIKKDTDIQNVFKNWTDAQNKYKEGTIEATEVEKLHKRAIDGLTESLKKSNPELKPEVVDSIAQSFILLGNTVPKATNGIDSATKSLTTLQKTLSDSASAISEIQSSLDSYNETGKFSLDNIIKLSATYPQLLGMLGDEKAIRTELTNLIQQEQEKSEQAYLQMIETDKDYYKNKILLNESYKSSMESSIQSLVDSYGINYQVDLKNFKSLAEAKMEVERQLLKTLSANWSQYYDIERNSLTTDYTELSRVDPEAAKKVRDAVVKASQLAKGFDGIALKSSGVDFSGIGMSGSKDKKEKSSPTTPLSEFVSIEESLIRSFLTESKITEESNKLLEKQLQIAKSAKDYNKELTLSKQLIEGQSKQISQLSQARSKMEDEFAKVSSEGGYSVRETLSWFDPKGEDTLAYQTKFKNSSVETRKTMGMTHDELQKLEKAYHDTGVSIDTLTDSLIALKNSLTQIEIDKFEQSLANLDKKINLSKSEMDLYDKSSEEYSKEQAKQITILKEKEDAIFNEIVTIGHLLKATDLTTESQKALNDEMANLKLTLNQNQKSLQDYANDIVQTLKDAAKIQETIDLAVIDVQMRSEDRRHQQVLDDIDIEEKAREDSINKQIDAIDRLANAENYTKDLNSAQTDAQDIQDQINIFKNDTSYEGKAKLAELQKQLAEKNSEIEDMQNSHTIDLRKQNLQDALDAIKKELEAKKQSENEAYEAKKQSLEDQKTDIETAFNELMLKDEYWLDKVQLILDGNIEGIQESLNTFADEFTNTLTTQAGKIDTSFQAIINTIKQIKSASKELDLIDTPQYASGTKSHPGGLAIIDDGIGGRELVKTPSGKMFLGDNSGPKLVNLPKDSEVYSHNETESLLNKAKLLNIPSYANGTGINGSLMDLIKNMPSILPNISLQPFKIPQLANNLTNTTTNNLNPTFNINVPKGTTRSQAKEIVSLVYDDLVKILKK